MITLEDYKNLLEYFNNIEVPENLKNFVEKLTVMYEELTYRDEVQKKLAGFREKLEELSKNEKED